MAFIGTAFCLDHKKSLNIPLLKSSLCSLLQHPVDKKSVTFGYSQSNVILYKKENDKK